MSTHRKQSVFLCRVPETFRPQRPWTVPEEVLSATLHAKNLTVPDANGFARAHNKRQVQAVMEGKPVESWAIVSRGLKPRRYSDITFEDVDGEIELVAADGGPQV